MPPGAARCAGDRRDPHRAARARPGARRPDAGRGRRARGAEGAQAARASGRSSQARPTTPGVYLFRDRNETVLYVGKARDLRARLRSYFSGDRQRPSVEAALGALERVEWRELGSELEASLEELRLIRELRPPANARAVRPDRASYLVRRGGRWVVTATPTRFGPIPSKRRVQLAARGARRLRRRRPRRRAPASPREAEAPRARPSLRGRSPAPRPGRRAGGGRRPGRRARPAACAGALHPRPRARARLLARVHRRAGQGRRTNRSTGGGWAPRAGGGARGRFPRGAVAALPRTLPSSSSSPASSGGPRPSCGSSGSRWTRSSPRDATCVAARQGSCPAPASRGRAGGRSRRAGPGRGLPPCGTRSTLRRATTPGSRSRTSTV